MMAYLLLGWILFVIGLMILVTRRSLLALVLAVLVMFNGTSVAWVASLRAYGDGSGHWVAFCLLAAITAQFLIGLGIVKNMAGSLTSVDMSLRRYLKN